MENDHFRYFLCMFECGMAVGVWMRVGCPCPPVRNDIVTPRHLFFVCLFVPFFLFLCLFLCGPATLIPVCDDLQPVLIHQPMVTFFRFPSFLSVFLFLFYLSICYYLFLPSYISTFLPFFFHLFFSSSSTFYSSLPLPLPFFPFLFSCVFY